jgi:DNA-binding transcriptional ArsR family regulator
MVEFRSGARIFNHMVELVVTYDLDNIFRALADPTRRAILRRLSEGERTVTELASQFKKMTLAAVSKHIQVLERAKLVRRRRTGSFYHIRLDAEALRSAEEWVGYYQQFWTTQLDALKTYIEGENL